MMALTKATGEALATALRIVIAAVGVLLTKYKVIDESQVSQALALVQDITTMAMIVVPAVWEIIARFSSELKTKEREAVAMNAGIKYADATQGPTPPVPHENVPIIIAAVTATPPQSVPQVDPTIPSTSDVAVARDTQAKEKEK